MTALPRYPSDIERAVQADVCPRLLAIAEAIAAVTSSLDLTTTPQGKSDKPALGPATDTRKAA